jgi:hypothetical protein
VSGKPYPEGIKRLCELFEQVDERRVKLSKLVPERDDLSKQIEQLQGELADRTAIIEKVLRDMDLESPGNFGWTGRLTWAIAEMYRQLKARVHGEP